MFKYLASVTHLDTVYCILHSLISMENPKVVVKLKSKQKPRGGGGRGGGGGRKDDSVNFLVSRTHTTVFNTLTSGPVAN